MKKSAFVLALVFGLGSTAVVEARHSLLPKAFTQVDQTSVQSAVDISLGYVPQADLIDAEVQSYCYTDALYLEWFIYYPDLFFYFFPVEYIVYYNMYAPYYADYYWFFPYSIDYYSSYYYVLYDTYYYDYSYFFDYSDTYYYDYYYYDDYYYDDYYYDDYYYDDYYYY